VKIVILMGSPRKKDGFKVCEKIKESLVERLGKEITFEYIMLRELRIEECRGCEQCLVRGEQYCPIKDGVYEIVEKMKGADGIIIESPVYACQVSGTIKKMIDRVSYLFHRPELLAKPIITVLTTAGGGIKPTKNYLKLVADGWGCHLDGQLQVVCTRYFDRRWGGVENPQYKRKIDDQIEQITERFVKDMQSRLTGEMPKPTLYDIYMFNALRSKTYTSVVDHKYWQEKGWMEKRYYYETKLPLGSGMIEKLMNQMIKMMVKKMGIQ